SYFDLLTREKRWHDARLLLSQMEPFRNGWNEEHPAYANSCFAWAKQYSKLGDHLMAVKWVSRAIDRAPERLSAMLRFRAAEYREIGDVLRADSDAVQAKFVEQQDKLKGR